MYNRQLVMDIEKFDPSKMTKVKNEIDTLKCRGGIWSSSLNPKNNHYDGALGEYNGITAVSAWHSREIYWNSNDEHEFDDTSCLIFDIEPTARIYVINSQEDIQKLADMGYTYLAEIDPIFYLDENETFPIHHIDFEMMSKDYDGVWLTEQGAIDMTCVTKIGEICMMTWDIESTIIWNPNIIIPIQECKLKDINF